MLVRTHVWAASALALIVAGVACGAGDARDGSIEPTTGRDAGTAPPPPPAPPRDGGTDAPPPLPPERELEGEYQAPVATGNYVWVTNPTSGRVAYINASTLDVKTVEAGNQPTVLAPVPPASADIAIVLNLLSQDATLLKATNGTLATRTFKVGKSANRWAISQSGRWAIAWTDWRKVTGTVPKTQGYQYMTVIDLTEQRATAVIPVGYRPVDIAFSSDGARAFAVCDDVISVVDLVSGAVPSRVADIAFTDGKTAATRDVSITPDGKHALVRHEQSADVLVVTLETEAITTVTLPGAVTDLDLSPEGDRAIAVMRDAATVAVLPLPGIVTDPTTFETRVLTGETVGSVAIAAGGKTALLYTNAAAVEKLVALTLEPTIASRTIRLRAPVHAVFPAPDAKNAVVLHGVTGGAFSLVPLAQNLSPTIIDTGILPHAVAMAPTSDRAVITVRDDVAKKYAAHVATLTSAQGATFGVESYTLASPPIAVGILASARRAYIAQQHAEGRITFIDLVTGQARTLTGFELGARIVNGSRP